ncbi:MAG: A/G-specific adenine glycosylase [Parvularculaceae bacterium]|nr:A/G-specific adenine glycosylase [Parvularculaceae bacterium]
MSAISKALLKWYDAHARELPWRVGPARRKAGERPDPYKVLLSEIMLQQTTAASVAPRFPDFVRRWPDAKAMAASDLDDLLGEWAGLGYYARARNLHKCVREIVARGRFPESEDELRALPGIGPYTAAAIAAIAFDRPSIVVDGNIERVAARLFAVETPPPAGKRELKEAIGAVWPKKRSGDFAQALMDLGAGVCTPRKPKCPSCPLAPHCRARARDDVETLPRKARKTEKPTRRGVAYALFNERGEILFERRPEKGLLGGMLGLPGAQWAETGSRAQDEHFAPFEKARWARAGTVRHTFTHFHLELDVMVAAAPNSFTIGKDWRWIAPEAARLPSVMKKAAALAAANWRDNPQ